MKKLLLLSINLILVSGCSNGISPQEKRNNFDACIIEKTAVVNHLIERHKGGLSGVAWFDMNEGNIPSIVNDLCVKFLK